MMVWCWKSIFKEGRLWRTHCLIRFFQDLRIGKMDKENDRIHGMVKMSLLLLFFFSSCGRDPFGTQPEGSVKRGRDQKLFLSQGISFSRRSREVKVPSSPETADILFYSGSYPNADGYYLGTAVDTEFRIQREFPLPFSFFDDFYYSVDRFTEGSFSRNRFEITEETPIRNALFSISVNGGGGSLIGIKEVNLTNVPPYIVFDYVVNHFSSQNFYHPP